jgi:HD-like signal output (HDOD) protein
MLIPSFVLTLYGVAWSVSAAVSRRRWLWATAIGSYLGALVMAAVSDRPEVYLIYAAALVLLVGLPGLVLMRQEPSRAS